MDTRDKLQQRYDEMCQNFEGGLSNTSTKKFDPIRELFAETFNIPTEDIYAVGSGSRPGNIEVRLSQGTRATTHTTLGLTFIVDPVGTPENRKKLTQSAFVTIEKFLGRGKSSYGNVLVIIDSKGEIFVDGLVHSHLSSYSQELVSAFNIPNVKEVEIHASKDELNVPEKSAPLSKEDLIKKVRDSFIRFWNLIDQHGADIDSFVRSFESAINPYLQELDFGYDNVFQIVDFNQYEIIISALVSKHQDLSYIVNGRINHGTKYEVGSTHLYYRNYLQIIAFSDFQANITIQRKNTNSISAKTKAFDYKQYLCAMRTKPFLLLAGISGTGKSRIVRQLAKACWPIGSDEANAHKPSNYEMIQVKPNWHDSSELIGYVSRIGDKPQFIAGDFLKFIAKAWENPSVPYFLCLDEMNLAPVEQYFAEYLSVIESRKLQDDGKTIITDPIIKQESGNSEDGEWYQNLCNSLTQNETLQHQFLEDGIRIPQNLIVVGTVNMDETTYSFSRKVLDRAMTIEMNEVKLDGGLTKADMVMPYIPAKAMLADAVEGCDVYIGNEDVADIIINYLSDINTILANTPFRIAYRTRNEFLIYVVNAIRLAGNDTDRNKVIADALDEVTLMKILSRIEGDQRKVLFLGKLRDTIKTGLDSIDKADRSEEHSVSLAKIDTMLERLKSGYTSFWD